MYCMPIVFWGVRFSTHVSIIILFIESTDFVIRVQLILGHQNVDWWYVPGVFINRWFTTVCFVSHCWQFCMYCTVLYLYVFRIIHWRNVFFFWTNMKCIMILSYYFAMSLSSPLTKTVSGCTFNDKIHCTIVFIGAKASVSWRLESMEKTFIRKSKY